MIKSLTTKDTTWLAPRYEAGQEAARFGDVPATVTRIRRLGDDFLVTFAGPGADIIQIAARNVDAVDDDLTSNSASVKFFRPVQNTPSGKILPGQLVELDTSSLSIQFCQVGPAPAQEPVNPSALNPRMRPGSIEATVVTGTLAFKHGECEWLPYPPTAWQQHAARPAVLVWCGGPELSRIYWGDPGEDADEFYYDLMSALAAV